MQAYGFGVVLQNIRGGGGKSCYIVVGCTEMGTNVCFSYLKYEENKKGKPDVCIESLKFLIL